MLEFDYIYSIYFKEYEKNQENILFFKEEIKSVLKHIYSDIEYSKQFIRINKKGIEQNYNVDLEKFNKDIKKYKSISDDEMLWIKTPMRISKIFAMSFNYLTYLDIREDTINEVFAIIREELLNVETAPSIKRQQEQLLEDFFKNNDLIEKSISKKNNLKIWG